MSGPVVVLVGPPGAGKTTVGRLVADRLGTKFRDTDEDVEAEAGKPISEIFYDEGEPHFRALEAAAVARALLHNLLAERRPLYEQVATYTVETDFLTPDEVADAVVEAIR